MHRLRKKRLFLQVIFWNFRCVWFAVRLSKMNLQAGLAKAMKSSMFALSRLSGSRKGSGSSSTTTTVAANGTVTGDDTDNGDDGGEDDQAEVIRQTSDNGNDDGQNGNSSENEDNAEESDSPTPSDTSDEEELAKNVFDDNSDEAGSDMPFEMYGTTSGNFYNNGAFAFYGDKVYYFNGGDLLCADKDLQNSVVIEKSVFGDNLSIVGDLCFYTTGSKISCRWLDGRSDEVTDIFELSDCTMRNACLIGQWVYFATSENKLYRFPLTDWETGFYVAEDIYTPYMSLCELDGMLYYQSENGIIRMEPDGSNQKKISDLKGEFVTDGKNLFLSTGKKLIFLDLDNDGYVSETDLLDLHDDETDYWIRNMNYADGYLYIAVESEEGYYLLSRTDTKGEDFLVYDTVICTPPLRLIHMCTNEETKYAYCYTLGKEEGDSEYSKDYVAIDLTETGE